MSKGEEVRGEMELVAIMLASVKGPNAEGLRPVVLLVGTVVRVKHRTLGYVRSSMTGRVRSIKIGFGPLLETTER